MKKTFLLLLVLSWAGPVHSQILMSLLFGDKLNSPFLEFGLEGGVNFSTLSNIEGAKNNTGFNLGFYFDIKSKRNPSWMLNTGVIVKSPMGSENLPVYSLNDLNLDNIFAEGNVKREIRYFNVPILIKYQFKNNLYLKTGPQLGLLARAYDEFSKEINGNDAVYKKNIRDQIHVIDAGIAVGAGYHLNTGNGINLGVYYYYGLVPLMKGNTYPDYYNRSFYITAGLPIGKGKAAKKGESTSKEALPGN